MLGQCLQWGCCGSSALVGGHGLGRGSCRHRALRRNPCVGREGMEELIFLRLRGLCPDNLMQPSIVLWLLRDTGLWCAGMEQDVLSGQGSRWPGAIVLHWWAREKGSSGTGAVRKC